MSDYSTVATGDLPLDVFENIAESARGAGSGRIDSTHIAEGPIDETLRVAPAGSKVIPWHEGRWRGHLPDAAKRSFCALYRVGQYDLGAGVKIRHCALLTEDRPIVIDPVDATEYPDAWHCVRMQPPDRGYDLYRRAQVMIHLDAQRLDWRWQRNQFLGRPAYVVGSGASAALACEVIPPRGARRGLVFAINNAAKVFPGDHDFWCLGDALWPGPQREWQDALLSEWAQHDHTGAWGLFHSYANGRAVAQFLERGGVSADFYQGWNINPYRRIAASGGVTLPSFCTGLQALVEVIHAAYWLGCSPIVLFGIEQGRPVGGATHAVPTVGWRTGSEPGPDGWLQHPALGADGQGGEVETCTPFMLTARVVAAQAAFLQDAGIPVFNASEGLELLFAQYLQPHEAVWLCESDDVGDLEHQRAMTPSLGRRARLIDTQEAPA